MNMTVIEVTIASVIARSEISDKAVQVFFSKLQFDTLIHTLYVLTHKRQTGIAFHFRFPKNEDGTHVTNKST